MRPEIDFRLSELRGVGSEAQRARHRELAPAAEREAVDGRNHGLAQPLEAIEDRLAAPRVLAAADRALHRELVDVGAGDERPVALPRQHEHSHIVVAGGVAQDLIELVEGLRVQRVENFRPGDRDDQHAGAPLDPQVFEGHNRAIILRGAPRPGQP